MRSITEAEAKAIRSMLAGLSVSERQRIRDSGIEPRTFARVRKRAYAFGWVFDRFVPDPSRTGFRCVCVALVQPFVEDIQRLQDRWVKLGSNILLWRWPETILAVFFSHEPSAELTARLTIPDERIGQAGLICLADSPTIPVYFDYEAAWARMTNQQGTLAYPHGIAATSLGQANDQQTPEIGAARVGELVARPFRAGSENAPLRVSPYFFPRSQQRLLDEGIVQRRTFLDLQRVPAVQGRTVERVAFIHGELNSPGTEESLFRLMMAIRVTPFLYASDGARVLLATLSPAPNDPATDGPRPNILASLQQYLRHIRIVREPLPGLSVVVNHRYDRLTL
jgi:hypothetical protein